MAVVLVEGITDRIALEAVATKLGREPQRDGVEIVPIGGAQAIRRAASAYEGQRVVGLCDAGEERWFRRVLGDATFVCVADLEDELIRALGFERVEEVIASEGELASFRKMQQQPAHRGSPVERQLRRFLGTHSGRKLQYARALVEALDLDAVPRPLAQLLAGAAA
jgi:hypothetical protein